MNSHLNSRTAAALELVFAAALWGFGFVAAVWALRSMGPLAVTGWRFVIGGGAGFAILLLIPSLRRQASWQQFRLAFWPGVFLFLTLIFQTWGLNYTTATKSGFITTLYVLMVPVIERVWLKRALPRFHFVYVLLALVGVGMVCDLGVGGLLGGLNFGDALTLVCAVAASLQIVWFGLIQKRIGSAFAFNAYQTVWAGVVPFGLALALEPPVVWAWDLSLAGLLMLALGSTLIAFALQVRAQKKISPSVASLLFLLESPFATLFAIGLLGENLGLMQWVGAGLILLAAGLSTVFAVETGLGGGGSAGAGGLGSGGATIEDGGTGAAR